MAISYRMRMAVEFFRANAGGIVGEATKGALALARAEQFAREHSELDVVWAPDHDADWSWLEQDFIDPAYRAAEHEVEGCTVYKVTRCEECGHETREAVAGLYGIFDATPDYRRVVEAELMLELMTREVAA